MPLASVSALMDLLRRHRLLEPARLDELAGGLAARFADARALAGELVRRDWLTPFQVNQIFRDRAADLVLGAYVLLERLGAGGMGEVFKARQLRLDRLVALKVIRPEHLARPSAVERFRREARAAARLAHPHIVTVHDADEAGGTHFIVMEYVAGTDLAALVKANGPLPVAAACDYVRQAALGLQHAHERGLVHRDVKPANLLLAADGQVVKILDMGLARLRADAAEEGADAAQLTGAGAVMGTPDYLAPEQATDAHGVDIRADLYSLGCTLYFLLTGRVPFPGGLAEKLLQHQTREPPPVEQLRPDVSPGVAAVVRRLMAKDPGRRYQTPLEAARALEDLSRQPPAALPVATVDYRPPPAPTATVPEAPAAGRPRRRALVLGGAGVLGVGLVVLLVSWLSGTGAGPAGTGPDQPARLRNALGMELVLVPAGELPRGRDDPASDEDPPRRIAITRPFYLGVHEVTQEQYRQVMGRNPSYFAKGGLGADKVAGRDTGRLPVENVSWWDAMEFCRRLSELPAEQQAGRVYRLPTEAEWEHACRAAGREPPTGAALERAWCAANSGGRTHRVGGRSANGLGLHDLEGNVEEWCLDWYAADSYGRGPSADPTGPDKGDSRVVRGGCWADVPADCRAGRRAATMPGQGSPLTGFRVVVDPGTFALPRASPPAPEDLQGPGILWNQEVRKLVDDSLGKGLRVPAGRGLYWSICDCLERNDEGRWYLGAGLTRDGQPTVIEVKDGQWTRRPVTAREARQLTLEPQSLVARAVSAAPPVHGDRLLSFRQARLRVFRDGKREYLTGRIYWQGSGPRPMADPQLNLRRRYHQGPRFWTAARYQPLTLTHVAPGWMTVWVSIPGPSPPAAEAGARPEPHFTLQVQGFVYRPQPSVYLLSGTIPLVVSGAAARPDPNWDDGWNRAVRDFLNNVLPPGLGGRVGRTVYGEVVASLDQGVDGEWRLGWGKTADGKPYHLEVKEGKFTPSWLTMPQATRLGMTEQAVQSLTDRSLAVPVQPLVRLGGLDMKAREKTGRPVLEGRVRSTLLADHPLQDLAAVLTYRVPAAKGGAQGAVTEKQVTAYYADTKLRPGFLQLRFELEPGPLPKGPFRLQLHAFLTWPAAGYYQISNELRFPAPKAAAAR